MNENFQTRLRDEGLIVPAAKMGAELLRQLEEDCNYINSSVLPMVREKGVGVCTTEMLINYAQNPHLLKWGASGREIEHQDLLTFTGKRMIVDKVAFRRYYEATPEGRAMKKFASALTAEACNLIMLTR